VKMWMDYQAIDDDTPTGMKLDEKDPKHDFERKLVERAGTLNAAPDPINRCTGAYCSRPGIGPVFSDVEQSLSRLVSRPAAGLRVIDRLPEATMLRIQDGSGKRIVYSMLRNRAHSNVAFLLGEAYRYQPGLDTLTIYPGVLSSYPNFIFNIPANEVSAFVDAMEQAHEHKAAFDKIVERWGVRRSNPLFWTYFHDLDHYIQETEPAEAGVLDMNRYENL